MGCLRTYNLSWMRLSISYEVSMISIYLQETEYKYSLEATQNYGNLAAVYFDLFIFAWGSLKGPICFHCSISPIAVLYIVDCDFIFLPIFMYINWKHPSIVSILL